MAVVPVHMGSPRFNVLEMDAFRVTEAWFPPGEVLPFHFHQRTVFAVMLEGSFEDRFRHRTLDCTPATAFVEPAGEGHENRIGKAGARVLVVQPDPHRHDQFRPVRSVFEATRHFRHPEITRAAHGVARETRKVDDVSPVAIESLVLEMMSIAARPSGLREIEVVPQWFDRAREMIHDSYREAPTVESIAAEVGVHRVHLSRTFRAHCHAPIATYVRRLRLEWAATMLLDEERSLASVALDAGFSDQSHFTRAFKRYMGITPGHYRRLHSS